MEGYPVAATSGLCYLPLRIYRHAERGGRQPRRSGQPHVLAPEQLPTQRRRRYSAEDVTQLRCFFDGVVLASAGWCPPRTGPPRRSLGSNLPDPYADGGADQRPATRSLPIACVARRADSTDVHPPPAGNLRRGGAAARIATEFLFVSAWDRTAQPLRSDRGSD